MTATPGATTRPAHPAETAPAGAPRGEAWGWEEPTPAPSKSERGGDHELAPALVRPARKVRGATLLASLLAVVIALPLAAFGALPWVVVLVPVAAVAASVAWLRQAVAAEQVARRAVRRTRGSEARRPVAAPAVAQPAERRSAPRRPVDREETTPRQDSADVATEGSTPGENAPARPSAPALYDFQEVERGLSAPAAAPAARVAAPAPAQASEVAVPARPLVDEDDIPLTWDPVPVPRPTYTMKSRATRPAPTAADLVGDADTEYAAYEQEPARRVAGA